MKKLFFTMVAVFCILGSDCVAQNSGLGFNYQAVMRRADGVLLSNADVNLRISLYPGQSATSPTWVETHSIHTDVSGCFGITVGKGTRASSSIASRYSDINFAAVFYWMKIEIQEGSSYREVSFSQLPSTPYSEVSHNSVVFAGMIAPFAGPAENIPDGWLLCDGRAINRSEYYSLYKAIGNSWGEGDGSTTFNLPDMRGMFLRGVSGNSGNDEDASQRSMLIQNSGGNTGNAVGSYQGDAIRNITGRFIGSWNGGYADGSFYNGAAGAGHDLEAYTPSGPNIVNFDASKVVPVGSDNRPKNVYVTYIIKY